MTSGDTLQRFVFDGAAIRGELVHLDATWRAVLERHPYPAAVRTILGELMAAAALLSATLKFDGSITLQIQGNGPVRLLVVESTSDRTLRAMAQWDGTPESGTFPELVGEGRFAITIDPRSDGQRYQGIVSLDGASVSATLENYLIRSEQLDSRIWLAADRTQAAGMLLQRLPDRTSEDPDIWNRATKLGSTIRRDELLQLPAVEIIRRLYHEEDIRLFDREGLRFHCHCTRDRVIDVLRMLGYVEVRAILNERDSIEVACEFCNQHYVFDAVDAEQLFASTTAERAGSTRH